MKSTDPTERAERITAELREATREAAGVLKDLRTAMREARIQVDGYLATEVQKASDHYMTQWQAGCDQFYEDFRQDVADKINQAQHDTHAMLGSIGAIDVLIKATAAALASLTILENGVPKVDYTRPVVIPPLDQL